MATPDRAAVAAFWRQRLQDAKLRLDFASNYVREIQRDFSSGELPAPDSQRAYEKAVRAERFALEEYRRIFQLFADLVVKGKMPDEAASG